METSIVNRLGSLTDMSLTIGARTLSESADSSRSLSSFERRCETIGTSYCASPDVFYTEVTTPEGVHIGPGYISGIVTLVFPYGGFLTGISPTQMRSLLDAIRTVQALVHSGQEADTSTAIKPTTARAALAVLQLIGFPQTWPTLSPDGEGGLMLTWDQPNDSLILNIDGWLLNAVVNPATPRAKYVDNISFDGDVLPESIAELVEGR